MPFQRGARTHKYDAVRTEVDGIKFASKAEAKRYAELKLLERAKQIANVLLQPSFDLLVWTGQRAHRIGEYRADFAYNDAAGRRVYEDVKGFKTPLYRWKKKHDQRS